LKKVVEMNKYKFSILVLFCALVQVMHGYAQKPTSYVNPLIGAGGHGHVFVGASVPFGAVQVGPSNIYKGWDWCSGYHYSDSILIGFPQTHLSGTGGSDLGDVLVMPFTGKIKTDKGTQENHSLGYSSLFSHATEKVRPGYYSVLLDDYKIGVELTASERVAFHQYQFPNDNKEAHIIIDLKEGINDKTTDTYIRLVNDTTIVGYRFSKGWANNQQLYFAAILSQPVTKFSVYTNDTLLDNITGRSLNIKGVLNFKQNPGLVKMKVAISPVSEENALGNIAAEIPNWNFNEVAKQANDKWNKELGKIEVETNNETDKRIFYTSLYHTMIDPALFNDHNNDYRGSDKVVYRNAPFTNYSIFSLWDTYRALHPLYTIIQPEKVDDIINSMLVIYQKQGKLPIWNLMGCESNLMPGISGVQVVAEAYMKGFKGFDRKLAYEAVKNSMLNNDSYRGLGCYKTFHYIPYGTTRESIARTMEYGISDGSIALMAKQLNQKDDYTYFTERSKYYKNYFDPATKFFKGKDSSGNWNPVFDEWKISRPYINDYCEGNVWEYTWLAPQDVEGIVSLLGGEKEFAKRLDYFFNTPLPHDPKAPPDIAGLVGMYAHGNEPGHHNIYLYAYVGEQWKTAEKARFILQDLYKDSTDGIAGNEDCGQMSAWYILSSLGFYPVFPANCSYVMGSPLFDKAVIHLAENKTLTIKAINNSPKNIYIQSVTLNGKPYDKTYLLHQDIVQGGTLEFKMGSKPNKKFGAAESSRPKSMY
jgi:predicted alpha-1,2-mannosidase